MNDSTFSFADMFFRLKAMLIEIFQFQNSLGHCHIFIVTELINQRSAESGVQRFTFWPHFEFWSEMSF